MQDSSINYNLTVQGAEESVAKLKTVENAARSAAGAVDTSAGASSGGAAAQEELSNSANKAARSTNIAAKSQENYFVHIAKTTVQSALVNKAFLGLTSAAGQAVQQVDLFHNFPASMAALGLSSKDATEALGKLQQFAARTGISLAEATTSVARFAEVTKDVKAATAEFVGVKTALIAGGAGAEVQKNALEQLIQAYSRGKPQLIEWRSLMVAMPAQLNLVAQAMKLPNAQALGEALTKGKVSMQDFVTELTKLSITGPIAQQAIARMQGIEYASNVMKLALVNGLAAIYGAVGRQNIIGFIVFLTQVIQVLARWAVIAINDLISLFNIVSRVFGGPQIKNFSGDAANASDALGTGAANAGDMADGLGTAADNAAKINKSLASFDKMNVLPDKTSGTAKDTGAGGTGPLDPATAALMDGLFNKIGGSLAEASKWAKILAGILGGIATNALIAKLFGINPLKGLISGLGEAAKGFLGIGKSSAEAAAEAEKNGTAIGNQFGKKFGEGAAKGLSGLGTVIAGAIGGIAGFLAESVAPVVGGFFLAVGAAIAVPFLALAEVLAIPVELVVAIVIAAVAVIVGVVWLIWTNWQTIWGFISGLFQTVWTFIVGLWNTLFDIFAAPIKFLLQFIEAVFILIVAIIATALQLIFDLVVGTILLIYNVLAAIADWIYNNVILPVLNFFVALWNAVVNAVVAAWQFIFNNVLLPVANWVNANVIQPIINLFKGLWSAVSGFLGGFVNSVYSFLAPLWGWINANVIGPIANLFSGLWNGVKTGLSNLMGSLESIFGSLGGIIKAPINGVIDLINTVLRNLNKIKVPSWVPGLGGSGVNFPMIPKLAAGGVVNQATLAMIGESGSEAVVPLENNTAWIDALATKLNENTGNNTQPIQLVVQIGEDKVASKIIDLINEKTNMSGRNTIFV